MKPFMTSPSCDLDLDRSSRGGVHVCFHESDDCAVHLILQSHLIATLIKCGVVLQQYTAEALLTPRRSWAIFASKTRSNG
jgi:hypothetical protein